MTVLFTRRTGYSSIAVLVTLLAGCSAPQPRGQEPSDTPKAPAATQRPTPPASVSTPPGTFPPSGSAVSSSAAEDEPRRDPVAYLRRVHDACTKLEAYHLIFVRQERRGIGLLKSLRESERIECWFRRTPFSIRMKWLDEDIKYGESTYVRGRDDDRLRFTPRPQLFNLPYRVYRVSPLTPVNWGECRYPVTEFGVEILMQRTLETIAVDPANTRVSYVAMDLAPGSSRTAHRIRIDYPRATHPAPVQELFIDPRTDLPLHTEMRFADGAIDTAYTYEDLDASVKLNDSDFLLEFDRTAAAANTP